MQQGMVTFEFRVLHVLADYGDGSLEAALNEAGEDGFSMQGILPAADPSAGTTGPRIILAKPKGIRAIPEAGIVGAAATLPASNRFSTR